MLLFLTRSVRRQSVEKMPSVQSFVATSSRPNIWAAVTAFGFILVSRWGSPHSVIAFSSTWMHRVFPAPDGPSVIIPWRTRCVSNSCNKPELSQKSLLLLRKPNVCVGFPSSWNYLLIEKQFAGRPLSIRPYRYSYRRVLTSWPRDVHTVSQKTVLLYIRS